MVLLVRSAVVATRVFRGLLVHFFLRRARHHERFRHVGMRYVDEHHAVSEPHQVPRMAPFENVEAEISLHETAIDARLLQIYSRCY